MEDLDYRVLPLKEGDLREIYEYIGKVRAEEGEMRSRRVGIKDLLESGFGTNKTLYGFVLWKRLPGSPDKIVGYLFYIYLFSTWAGHYVSVADMMIFSGTDQKLQRLLIQELVKMVEAESLPRLEFTVPRAELANSRIVSMGAKPLPEWYMVRFSSSAMTSLVQKRNEQVLRRYHIREVNYDDMESVLFMIQCLAEYEKEPDAVKTDLKVLVQGLGKFFNCFVAEVNELGSSTPEMCCSSDTNLRSNKMPHNPAIVGIAIYLPIFCKHAGKVLHLEDLYVAPDHRQQGLGTELIRRVAEVALLNHCSELNLNVLDWNTKAVNFYMKLEGKLLTDNVITRIEQKNFNTLELRKCFQ